MSTMAEVSAVFIRRIEELAMIPHAVVSLAHSMVMAGAPVYTGAYREAIEMVPVKGPDVSGAMVMMTEEALVAASNAFYAYGEAHPPKGKRFTLVEGSEPYPLRIEAIGSPVYNRGQDNWANARREAGEMFAFAFLAAIRS